MQQVPLSSLLRIHDQPVLATGVWDLLNRIVASPRPLDGTSAFLLTAGVSAIVMAVVVASVRRAAGVSAPDTVELDLPDPGTRSSVEEICSMPHESITTSDGRFSQASFRETTNLTPGQFIVLYLERNGGSASQRELTRCLPWSKSSVSRYLDSLEARGAVERVTHGRTNIVQSRISVPLD